MAFDIFNLAGNRLHPRMTLADIIGAAGQGVGGLTQGYQQGQQQAQQQAGNTAAARFMGGGQPAQGAQGGAAPLTGQIAAMNGTGGAGGGGFLGALKQIESGGQNVYSKVDQDVAGPNTRSQGYDQINVPTWRDFAPKAGVDLKQYPTPMSAPEAVQDKVASTIPFGRFGPATRKALESRYGFGEDAKQQTVGELASRYGAGGAAPPQQGNFQAATQEMRLNPQEQALYK